MIKTIKKHEFQLWKKDKESKDGELGKLQARLQMDKRVSTISKGQSIMKTQLLLTFTTHSKLNLVVDSIIDSYTILFDKIYVFQNEDDLRQLIFTYNIEMVEDYYDGDECISGTISLHRKKQSNTLYTIKY